jgi:hypothetical protein
VSFLFMLLRYLPYAALALGLLAHVARADDVPIPCEAVDSVGSAKMSADGTITLRIRSLWPQPIAEAELIYTPDNPQHGEIKRHLGGIAPGETKPVPPWCGTNSEP